MAAPFINFYSDDEMIMNFLDSLNEYGKKVADEYKQRLEADDKRATGKLIDSITPVVDKNWGTLLFTVNIKMEDYWKYVEKGLKGRGSAIKNSSSPYPVPRSPGAIAYYLEKNGWLDARGLPRESKWAIAQSIWDKGIKKGEQFQQTVQAVNGMYLPKLQEALEKDIDNIQYKVWSDVNKLIKV